MIQLPAFIKRAETARLIPSIADTKKEERAASILLAAFRSVYEFRQVMLASLGMRIGARAELEAWTEVVCPGDAKLVKSGRPDGLMILSTGRKTWSVLIEAKIGNAEIDEEQVRQYLQVAKQNKIDAVITISNQFVALPTHYPIKVPKTLLRGVELYHWSWMYAVTQATLLLEDGAISSPDQRFILEEMLRYMNHESSGISRFHSMNKEWKDLVGRVKSGANLAKGSDEVQNTVSSWHQEQRDLCLVMSRRLGQNVKLKISRAHSLDPIKRLADDCDLLAKAKVLRCQLDVPNAATDIDVVADLTTRTITCSMKVAAPLDKQRTSARVNWLLRQLKNTNPDGIYIKACRPGRAGDTQEPLKSVMDDPEILECKNRSAVPTAFEVCYLVDLAGRFSGSKIFIDELESAVPYFYEQVGENLRAWVAPPPKIEKRDPVEKAAKYDDREQLEAALSNT